MIKPLTVHCLVDPMGSSIATPAEEYLEIKAWVEEHLCRDVTTFKEDVMPHRVQGCDIYVFDYGGMLPGCEGMINSLHRSLSVAVRDRPNTLFIIWSSFTSTWYQRLIAGENPELADAPNLIFGQQEDKLVEWFND